jgi:hypothetical protein
MEESMETYEMGARVVTKAGVVGRVVDRREYDIETYPPRTVRECLVAMEGQTSWESEETLRAAA